MTSDDVQPYASERLSEFTPTGPPAQLAGGNLNVVWRVPGEPASVIVKYAPPHIAANPDVPLDPSRLLMEARSLEAFMPEGRLAGLRREGVRPPRLLDVTTDPHVLIMEDMGDAPDLGAWLRAGGTAEEAEDRGRRLGTFIGRLHAETQGDAAWADAFNNRSMQETRHAVQYEPARDYLAAAGVDDAERLGDRAEALGERLLEPGRCHTMGDLWPPSVLVAGEELRLIDWELAHYGQPAQDVAHFAAHLWMQAHRAPDAPTAARARSCRQAFLEAYRAAIGSAADGLLDADSLRDCAIHFGCEILARTTGAFQEGYLYDGLAPDHEAMRDAVSVAAAHIRMPQAADTLEPLRR